MRRPLVAIVATLFAVPGCVLPGDAAGTSGIHGQVLIGPTCPVEKDPPDPKCADRPYAGALAVMTADLARVVKEFESEANGTFRVPVPPGDYAIRHKDHDKPYPTCSSNETVVVAPGAYTWVFVHCDSGIR